MKSAKKKDKEEEEKLEIEGEKKERRGAIHSLNDVNEEHVWGEKRAQEEKHKHQ